MVHAKNYETTSTFVKVMQKKPWSLFFRTRCISVALEPRKRNHSFGHGVLENLIQALSRTFRHRFKDFQGPCLFSRTFQALKICKKKFKDFQGPAKALHKYEFGYLCMGYSKLKFACIPMAAVHIDTSSV